MLAVQSTPKPEPARTNAASLTPASNESCAPAGASGCAKKPNATPAGVNTPCPSITTRPQASAATANESSHDRAHELGWTPGGLA